LHEILFIPISFKILTSKYDWPEEINGFTYRALLYHALRKDCAEAEVVSWVDKVEGFCECLHEVHAGNQRFVGAGKAYVDKINGLTTKHPRLRQIAGKDHPLLQLPTQPPMERILHDGRHHTEESVKRNTGIPHYDRWKELTMAYFGIGELVDIRER